ncbi:LysM peptidoglycan-binding domain-containing protein [Paenibacillus sp.]|uniref:LysM peptidoglycan-binding domain-containing protein n=1 Tax=Paenibacillus sp. TaxID=58172 RepID=UPI002D410503|nr:LysM peptidoglycan-binding domain-containing protein [Paenibacillus sp.]HZG88168.1 LysM peptidoglycan-binding domain-containing protein [Paenibacillus sp.]
MLYVVRRGDHLSGIAARFGTTVSTILEANIICNPNLIFVGQPLLIPDPGIEYPRAGGFPSYVIQYGDTLSCLAPKFGQTVSSLAAANRIADPNLIYVGNEIIVGFPQPNPAELLRSWETTAEESACQLSSLQEHGIYYIGSFQWETLGETAVPYLVRLLRNSCRTVRYYAVMSLGRIGAGFAARAALEAAANDPDADVARLARLGLRRLSAVQRFSKRLHVSIADQTLYAEPNLQSSAVPLPEGAHVISLRWNIPSATNEEGPRGGLQIYDQVQVSATGQVGYLPRAGFNDILLI